jgi:uncharacterized protein (DUF362 family)
MLPPCQGFGQLNAFYAPGNPCQYRRSLEPLYTRDAVLFYPGHPAGDDGRSSFPGRPLGLYIARRRKADVKVFYASTAGGVRRAVFDLMDALGWEQLVPPGGDVLLKVNLTWDYLRPGVDTGPWVLEAVAARLKTRASRVFVGESSQILVEADRALEVSGVGRAVSRQGLIWHNFSKNEWIRVEREGLEFGIPLICTQMPVISVPVVKTHYRTVISAALKNLYGCLNDGRQAYHHRLADYLAAVHSAIPVRFTVADGTVSLEGNGPKPGRPKPTGFAAASVDPVALDHSLAGVMGFDPAAIGIIRRCEGVAGTAAACEEAALPPLEAVPRFSFLPARPNFVARVEKAVRGSRKGGAGSKVIAPLRLGARYWYRIAYHLLRQRREAMDVITATPCGRQWLGEAEEEQ